MKSGCCCYCIPPLTYRSMEEPDPSTPPSPSPSPLPFPPATSINPTNNNNIDLQSQSINQQPASQQASNEWFAADHLSVSSCCTIISICMNRQLWQNWMKLLTCKIHDEAAVPSRLRISRPHMTSSPSQPAASAALFIAEHGVKIEKGWGRIDDPDDDPVPGGVMSLKSKIERRWADGRTDVGMSVGMWWLWRHLINLPRLRRRCKSGLVIGREGQVLGFGGSLCGLALRKWIRWTSVKLVTCSLIRNRNIHPGLSCLGNWCVTNAGVENPSWKRLCF